jgi:hypothetical protein
VDQWETVSRFVVKNCHCPGAIIHEIPTLIYETS